MGYRRCATAALALLGPLAACDELPTYQSEQGQLGIMLDGFTNDTVTRPLRQVDAIVGTRLCPTLDGWYEYGEDETRYHVHADENWEDGWLHACFAQTASGTAHLDDECIVLDAAGDAALELSPQSCITQETSDVAFTPDRLAIRAWGFDELELGYDDVIGRKLREELVPGPGPELPPLDVPSADAPMRAIAGELLLLIAHPFAADDPLHPVGYDEGTPSVVGDGVRRELDQDLPGAVLGIQPGDRFAVELAMPAGTLTGPEIVAVDATEAVSLELLAGYEPCDDCRLAWGALAAVQAIVRDAEGNRLYGASVEFTSDELDLDDEALFPDALIPKLCEDSDDRQVHSGTVRAEYRGLTAALDVQYQCGLPAGEAIAVVEDDPDADEGEPPMEELLGCGCSSTAADSRAGLLGVLGLVVLGLRRRRRG